MKKDIKLSEETIEWFVKLGANREEIAQVESDMREHLLHMELSSLEEGTGINPEPIYEQIFSYLSTRKKEMDEKSYTKVLIAIQRTLDAVAGSAIMGKQTSKGNPKAIKFAWFRNIGGADATNFKFMGWFTFASYEEAEAAAQKLANDERIAIRMFDGYNLNDADIRELNDGKFDPDETFPANDDDEAYWWNVDTFYPEINL